MFKILMILEMMNYVKTAAMFQVKLIDVENVMMVIIYLMKIIINNVQNAQIIVKNVSVLTIQLIVLNAILDIIWLKLK